VSESGRRTPGHPEIVTPIHSGHCGECPSSPVLKGVAASVSESGGGRPVIPNRHTHPQRALPRMSLQPVSERSSSERERVRSSDARSFRIGTPIRNGHCRECPSSLCLKEVAASVIESGVGRPVHDHSRSGPTEDEPMRQQCSLVPDPESGRMPS
jgi:hypothetical protein